MTQNDIADRLDALEAQLDDQQKTIDRQQERIEAQEAIINAQQKRLDADGGDADDSEEIDANGSDADGDDSERAVLNRRTALQAGGVLGLLGLGAGTASADASGQIGTSSDPLQQLYTEELNGGVTGDAQLTNIAGSNLSIDSSGNLNASGGGSGAWVEGDNTSLLEPVSKDGIEVDTIADNGSGSVTMNSALDLTDNQINYGTNAGSQTLADLPFGSSQRDGSTNSYAMQLDGDDVLTINGVNDGSGNLSGAYVWVKKELRLSGTLNTQDGTIENTIGGLTVTTNDNGNLTLDPGANNEVDVKRGGLDLNGRQLKSSSYGNVWDLRTSSNVGGGQNRTFSLEINDDGSSDNDITWQRAGNEDAAFRVVDRTNDNDLLTVNDGGDVDVHNGNLDAQGGTVENTTGPLSLSTSSGDLTLDPSGNIDLNSNRISNAKEIHSDSNNITFKGTADVNLDGTRLTEKGGDMNIASTNSVNVDIDNDNNDSDGTRDFNVTKDGGATTLFTVNDGGEVDILQGDLDMNGGTVVNESDARLKTAIEPIENPAEKLAELEPRTYAWKDDEAADGREAGVLAQSVEDVLPEAVKEDEDGFLKLAYRQLTPLVISAVQDQQDEIETLEADLDAKDARIDDQHDRIERLESKVDNKDVALDALREALDDRDGRIDDLEAENEQLRERNAELEDRLAAVEAELGIDATASQQGVADD